MTGYTLYIIQGIVGIYERQTILKFKSQSNLPLFVDKISVDKVISRTCVSMIVTEMFKRAHFSSNSTTFYIVGNFKHL